MPSTAARCDWTISAHNRFPLLERGDSFNNHLERICGGRGLEGTREDLIAVGSFGCLLLSKCLVSAHVPHYMNIRQTGQWWHRDLDTRISRLGVSSQQMINHSPNYPEATGSVNNPYHFKCTLICLMFCTTFAHLLCTRVNILLELDLSIAPHHIIAIVYFESIYILLKPDQSQTRSFGER